MNMKLPGVAFVSLVLHVTSFAAVITPGNLSSVDPELQSRIAIQQTDAGGTDIQVRNNSSSIRSAGQTFTWNTADELDSLGIFLHSKTSGAVKADQSFELRFYNLTDGSVSGNPFASYQFTLTSSLAQGNTYLYFELPESLALVQDTSYLFQLVATSQTDQNLLYLARSTDTNPYTGGVGNQFAGVNPPASIGVTQWDYTFFMTSSAIPEPGSLALFGMVAVGAITFFRKRGTR